MQLRITPKLLLAFLLTNTLVVGVMVLVMRWSFARGFLDYIHQQEVQRLDSLVTALEQAYAEQGSWHFLRHHPRRWRQFLDDEQWLQAPGTEPSEDDHRRRRRKRHAPLYRPDDPLSLRLRISVLDADYQPVSGPPRGREDDTLRPILAAGQRVGWLRIMPLRAVTETLDQHFLAQQSQAFVVISALALVLAAGVSLLLGRHLLAPIQDLVRGTRALAAGQFATRLRVTAGDELGQLAADFNVLAQTLEHNEHLRRQWTADMSHELRTPLAILRGEIEALQDGIRPYSTDAVASLHAEVLRLHSLVEDLYDLSLSDLGALHYRKTSIDLVALLDEAVTAFRERFSGHDLVLEASFPKEEHVLVFADRTRLHQLFGNLLENAWRYTDLGGHVRVWYARHDTTVVVHVQDSAPGVAPEVLPQLFERFYRLEAARTRAQGGAGLGLAICKNIVEAHGGQISAHASPLGGLWMQVALPVHT